MTKSEDECFLEDNRSAIVNGVTTVHCDRLVDFLIEKKILASESGTEVQNLIVGPKKMRKLLEHVKTRKACELVVQWLKKNMPDLMEDLAENNSDSDHDAPAKKKLKRCVGVDEADSYSNKPDLKAWSFPQLEEWVSNPKNSQTLIEKLKNKLADGEMEALEKQLQNKKVKTRLCFSAENVKTIKSNQKLKQFFAASTDAKFPDLPLKLFFGKDRNDESMPEKDDNDDDVFSDKTADLNSSGYGSLCSSSFNSNQSIHSRNSSESKDQSYASLQYENAQHNVQKTTVSNPGNSNVPFESEQRLLTRAVPKQSQHEREDCTPRQDTTVELPPEFCQNESLDPMQHEDKDNTPLEEDIKAQETVCEVNMQAVGGSFTGKLCEPFMSKSRAAETIPPTTQSFPTDDRILSVVPRAGPENVESHSITLLDKKVLPSQKPNLPKQTENFMRQIPPNMKSDPEMANNEPVVEPGQTCVAVDSLMQMKRDLQFEGMDEASQKEHRGANISKEELPAAHYQNASFIQMQHEDKDGTPLEKAMETQEIVCEPCTSPQKPVLPKQAEDLQAAPCQEPDCNNDTPLEKTLDMQESESYTLCDSNGNRSWSCASEPLRSIACSVAAENPMQSESQNAPQEESKSQPVTLLDTTVLPSRKPNLPEQTENLRTDNGDYDTLLEQPMPMPMHLDRQETELNAQYDSELIRNYPGHLGMEAEPLMSKVPDMHTNEKRDTDALMQNKDTDTPPLEQTVNAIHIPQENVRSIRFSGTEQNQKNGPSNSTIGDVEMNGQTVLSSSKPGKPGFCSTPSDLAKAAANARRRRQQQNKKKQNIRNDQRRLLHEWAKKQCGSEGDVEEVFKCISIKNQVEHSEYPCFVAENVMIYTDPKTKDKQIIVTDEKNHADKKCLPKETRVLLNYTMWVCDIKKAVLINQKEMVIDYQSFEATIGRCERLVFEAFAPALAVFKNIQRQEMLYSLTENH